MNERNDAIATTLKKVGARTIGYVKPRLQTVPVNGWFDMRIKRERLERKRRNRAQKSIKKLVERGKAAVEEAQVALNEYEYQKKVMSRMLNKARGKDEKRILEDLRK